MQIILLLIWYWYSILIQSKFYLAATLSKRYPCTQQDVQKVVENSLPDTPSRVTHSEKNRQAAEEAIYPGSYQVTQLKNEGWRFTWLSKLIVNC